MGKGELLGVLGHNGAGKTTLINILTGVMEADSQAESEICIKDYSLYDNPNLAKRQIGVCPQFDILWTEMTAA